MLGYRHAYHVGNHGDVVKHLVLRECLRYLNRKPKSWQYIDTHAGAGAYELAGVAAQKTLEFEQGIARLRDGDGLPPALADLLAAVDTAGESIYPGSPLLAAQLARGEDRLWCYELRSSDFPPLKKRFARDRRVHCERSDGYVGLRAHLPPPNRRGLVLIDPSYEMNRDYDAVVQALRGALARFETGVYLIWYPQLPQAAAKHLPGNLRAACGRPWLDVSLRVSSPSRSGLRMHGSGVFIANPPYGLVDTLRECLPVLVDRMAQGDGAEFTLQEG